MSWLKYPWAETDVELINRYPSGQSRTVNSCVAFRRIQMPAIGFQICAAALPKTTSPGAAGVREIEHDWFSKRSAQVPSPQTAPYGQVRQVTMSNSASQIVYIVGTQKQSVDL
eukprot:3095356-Rhodomonas_salina.1